VSAGSGRSPPAITTAVDGTTSYLAITVKVCSGTAVTMSYILALPAAAIAAFTVIETSKQHLRQRGSEAGAGCA
jgi:hypothetical protein